MRVRDQVGLSLLCTLLFIGQVAHADDDPMLDYLSVSLGMFANNTSASMRADGNIRNSGTRLDFSHDLGQGGTRALPYLDVTWRPWERHEFEFTYYHDSHDASRTLQRDIEFNNRTLLLGASLDSRFTLDAASIIYRYWAWIGDRGAFGIAAGLQAYHFELRLTANAQAMTNNGGASANGTTSASASSDIPDPSLGLSYRYQFVDWARFVADGGAFKANVDQVDATLYNARVGMEFYPWKNFGVVTQYAFNRIDADISKSRFNGDADFKFRGFQLLIKARF